MPARFDLTYVDRDGSKKTPVVIHRAILGSIDRFIAYYLEEKRGVLPLWVSPVQISILPVNNEYHLDYAKKVEEILRNMDIRVELDSRDEKLGYRMRESQMKKVPISLVLGNSERDEETVTIRFFGKEDKKTMKLDEFISYVKGKIDNREYDLD